MSLSDWDVLALDDQGRPSNGTSAPSPGGVVVAVREGWLTIDAPEAWRAGGLFPAPQVGTVMGGDLALLDTHVMAERTPGDGLVWATWFSVGKELTGTVGTAVPGAAPGGPYAGVTAADVEHLRARLAAWAAAGRLPGALAHLGFQNALRYNQGDAFFAAKMGHALSATKPGEAETPFLYRTQSAAAPPVSA